MCARFEAALAEDAVDEALRIHEKSCERCADLARDLAAVEAFIAEATGEVDHLSEDFLDRVLARADALEGRVGDVGATTKRPVWPAVAVGFVAAAAMLLAFWAGGAREQSRQDEDRVVVRVQAPTPMAAHQVISPVVPSQSMKRNPVPEPVVALRAEPTVPAASPVPEPVQDLGAEIQVMLREKVTTNEGCPTHNTEAVWVTATVRSDGSLTNRSIMSAGAASEAHRCVTRSLDQLLLPPGSPETTVTFELSW
jgi:hypothetical protein